MNISQVIRDAARENSGADTRTIAQATLAKIDAADYEDAILALLARTIPVELARQRQSTLSAVRHVPTEGDPSLRDPRLLQRIEAYMDALVPVGGRNVRRGDLTADDCRFLYRRNFEHAQATLTTARGYLHLAETLESENKSRLDELDGQLVKDVLDGKVPALA